MCGGKSKMRMTCQYFINYLDYESMKEITFKCWEEIVEGGLCIFHHPTYWENHQNEVREKFYRKVRSAVEKEEELKCIGYNLPNIELELLEFKAPVCFNFAKFHQHVWFESVKFFKADFYRAEFLNGAKFRAEFSELAFFSGAKFSGEADFSYAIFLGEANFTGAIFYGNRIIFSGAIFYGNASFLEVLFSGDVLFNVTIFLGTADFSGAIFLEDVSFNGAKFWPGFPITDLNVTEFISFMNLYFEKQERVFFNDVDMGKVSFIDTDVSRVRFRNVRWDEYRGGYRLYDQKMLMLIHNEKYRCKYFEQTLDRLRKLRENEEELKENVKIMYKLNGDEFDKKVEEVKEEIAKSLKISVNDWGKQLDELYEVFPTVEDILSVYRFLRENYDYYLRYEDSGKFFIGEMETMRNFKGRFERAILTAYKWLCQYGESYTKPILWSLVTVIIFALIPIAEAVIPIVKAGIQLEASTLIPLLIENLKISVATFLQMYLELKTHIIIERILSIMILGSLYISLRRKLERKIRH